MVEMNEKSKNKSNKVYDGNWNFINPRWIFILILIYEGVDFVINKFVDYQGIRIAENIIIKRAFSETKELVGISATGLLSGIIHLGLIVAILVISVAVLPEGRKHDRLRLAGIFVMTGALFKAVTAFVHFGGLSLCLEIGNAFKLPIFSCADLYILGGLIAIIVLFVKEYSNQEIEEIILSRKNRRKNRLKL